MLRGRDTRGEGRRLARGRGAGRSARAARPGKDPGADLRAGARERDDRSRERRPEPAGDAEGAIDVARLSAVLEVLANPTRLEILRQLRDPRVASELRVAPSEPRPGENPQRPISKQAVRQHLARLADIGVVTPERARRGGQAVEEYSVNQPRLFAIAEEFRLLATLRAPLDEGGAATMQGAALPLPGGEEPPGLPPRGVRFVVVHGLGEGRSFPLGREGLDAERGWVIGRRRGCAVRLDYDPFVSSENSEVTWEGSRFLLQDLRSSRNGTSLNWQRLPKGGSVELTHGDVIGVGRSLLLFRTA